LLACLICERPINSRPADIPAQGKPAARRGKIALTRILIKKNLRVNTAKGLRQPPQKKVTVAVPRIDKRNDARGQRDSPTSRTFHQDEKQDGFHAPGQRDSGAKKKSMLMLSRSANRTFLMRSGPHWGFHLALTNAGYAANRRPRSPMRHVASCQEKHSN